MLLEKALMTIQVEVATLTVDLEDTVPTSSEPSNNSPENNDCEWSIESEDAMIGDTHTYKGRMKYVFPVCLITTPMQWFFN